MDTWLQEDNDTIVFGRYRLLPRRGELRTACGRAIPLGPRATAVLLALIGARGGIVSQEALLKSAWPGQDIHASNLRVQIAALRRALGEGRELIGTVAGRGYLFAGVASSRSSPSPSSGATGAVGAAGGRAAPVDRVRRAPLRMPELIGRQRHLQEALARLDGVRMLTLAGIGGIGKTVLAQAMVRRRAAESTNPVCWVELADVRTEEGVAAAVARALGWPAAPYHTAATLAAEIGRQPLLLALDNCEHVADSAARLAETLLQRCPRLRLLATSRQPLLAAGETVWRVPPLAAPPYGEGGPAHALQSSAVQLFLARVRAADSQFDPTPRALRLIARVCHRLDGLPLAIELAAACVPALGLEQTANGLDDVLRLLRNGRRNAPPRHQTMRAALDWSYALLGENTRLALCHLAMLPDGFTIEAAVAALKPQGLSDYEAIDSLAGLVAHSLLGADHSAVPSRYRMLATTRAYAVHSHRYDD
ncbi:ATP-binding protein [Pseudoduganella namucuonensis]|uniref:Non-specific serine/threonine protein kinase n=1 Tax=Pseudoduganella namucuonensis TaxID=1035707 RepID=A0A1I7JEB9_9BURK|nr:winged helix-turn-helix domain-containing protein [Pseudoduganella namucuonensis]SFU83492.1 non-specific serine/threonine protein kinase [Pseudoduganella namucuonensis]